MALQYLVGVDVGGTFTDTVVLDENGAIHTGKALSSPPDYSDGILNSLGVAAGSLGLEVASLLRSSPLLVHCTTIAENALVTGRGQRTGLITTMGFEDILTISRSGYGRWFGLTEEEIRRPVSTVKPIPIAPRRLIMGVNERIDYKGKILREIDDAEVRVGLKSLVEKGMEAVGICLLWSFKNPENEKKVEALVKKLYPKMFVTCSSDLSPVLGEYERASSVVLNSHLGRIVFDYLNSLATKLAERGFRGQILVMQAYGGVLPVKEAATRAVGLIESGPAAGMRSCSFLGEALQMRDIIACDMGGTTIKAGVIKKGEVEYQREPSVLRYHYSVPKMDVVSIGAGGGSIISIDDYTNLPKVGPRSAEAVPGPICYDQGGEDPTVTDVDLILGYIDPDYFLGGRMKLNKEKAVAGFTVKVARPLGLAVMEAAATIYRITNAQFADLVHRLTVERGLDPREYTVFAYGGAAPLHACAFCEELNIGKILIPFAASVNGALGAVSSDVIYEYVQTYPVRLPTDSQEVNRVFADLRKTAMTRLQMDGFTKGEIVLMRSVDMRYRQQVHEITVPIKSESNDLTNGDIEEISRHFESLYEQKYGKGSAYREAGIAMVTFRLKAIGKLKKYKLMEFAAGGAEAASAFIGERPAYFEKAGGMVSAGFYDYKKLRSGNVIDGPAILLAPDTTIVVNPRWVAEVDAYRDILLTNKVE